MPAVLALVDWYAVARADRHTETWAKPAVLVALIVTAVVLDATDTTPGLWLLAALVLGLVGDVFLLGDSDTRFRLGLAAFLVGHLAYVVSFVRLGLDPAGWAWAAWVVLLACLLATRQVAPATYLRSGWALAAWEPVAGRLLVQQVHDHQGNHGQGMVPLLAIDAWEHAYYLQYLNEKAEFFDAIWNVVNWPDVQRRFEQARAGELVGATS